MLAAAAAAATTTTTMSTTITSDPGILCFHHCNVKVFCFTLPHICPNCHAELDASAGSGNGSDDNDYDDDDDADADAVNSPKAADHQQKQKQQQPTAGDDCRRVSGSGTTMLTTKLLPFRLPYPFVRATQYPCAIVLRPSTGDFLNDYSNATDLHIAVTTSACDIVEFDRDGLQRHRRDDNPVEWWQSLLVGDVPEPWYDYWDEILQQICTQRTRWSIEHYEEAKHNCYSFVLAFLQALGYDKLSEAARSRTSFCEKYIVPRTTTAGKYISLYRKLRAAGIYVHQQQQKQQQKQKQQQHHLKGTSRQATKIGMGSKIAKATISNASAVNLSPTYTHSIISRPHTHKLCTIEE